MACQLTLGLAPQDHSIDSPIFTYDQLQDAERREATAETRFVIGGVVAAIVLATLLLRAVAHYRRKIRPGQVPDATTKPPAMALTFSIRVLSVVFYALGIAAIAFYLASCTNILPEYEQISAMQAVWLFAGLLWLGSTCTRHAARLRMPLAEDVLASDERPPILFLRSFSEEEVALMEKPWWYESSVPDLLEEAVLGEFRKVGPVVGLTNRRLRSRPSTYAPYDTETEKWQERAEELMRRAAAVVVVLAISEGLTWEIRRLGEMDLLSRTMFVLPPLPSAEMEKSLRWLISELGLPSDVKGDFVTVSRLGKEQPLAIVKAGSRLTTYLSGPDKGGYMLVAKRCLQDIAVATASAAKKK